MRMNWIVGICAPMLTLLVGLAFGSTCHAQAASAVSTTATGPRAALIKQLRSAHKLLVIADHDYDGHRAARRKRSIRPSAIWKERITPPRSKLARQPRPPVELPPPKRRGDLAARAPRHIRRPVESGPGSFEKRADGVERTPPQGRRQRRRGDWPDQHGAQYQIMLAIAAGAMLR